jgi:hypothetical protein
MMLTIEDDAIAIGRGSCSFRLAATVAINQAVPG